MVSEYKVVRWSKFEAPDPQQLRRILTDEGYGVFQWSDEPGTTYGLHRHSTHQSHWIISGVLELKVDGVGTVTLNPGDRDIMPANTKHSARVVSDEPVVYLIGEKSS
jgi:quercetin dioxygenase-like cupin family protein